ncbi:MAG: hypothetical protein ACK5NG_10845 [Chthoniobacterales bacterium]
MIKKNMIKNALARTLAGAAMLLPAVHLYGSVIVHDGFDNSASGTGGASGIYESGTAIAISPNNNTTGGSMVGFESSRSWSGGSYFLPTDNGTNSSLSVGTNTGGTVRFLGRQLSSGAVSDISGQSVLYASTSINFTTLTSATSDVVLVGFTGVSGSTSVGAGAMVGLTANGSSGWDIQVRFATSSSTQTATIATDVAATDDLLVVWKMDQLNGTIDFWLNPTSEGSSPTGSFSTFSSSGVEDIAYASSFARLQGASGEQFNTDFLTLGTQWNDVFPIPEPTVASLIPFFVTGLIALKTLKRK